MTTKIAKPLRLIEKGTGCEYYCVEGSCLPLNLLKIYDNPLQRLLTSYTKMNLLGGVAETEIVDANQGRILRLCGIEPRYDHPYYGKVLIVEVVKTIPINFVFDGEGVDFVRNKEVISTGEVLRELPQDDPPAFLEEIIVKINAIHLKAQECFSEEKMSIENLKLNFGTRSFNGEPPVPLWVGDGITPRTAIIFDDEEQVIDCIKFTKKIVHPLVLEREMRGINISRLFLLKNLSFDLDNIKFSSMLETAF